MSDLPTEERHSALDNPAFSALTGPHTHLAVRRGRVHRYPADVCPFVGMPTDPDDTDWHDAAALVGPGGMVALAASGLRPPPDWRTTLRLDAVQLAGDRVTGARDEEAVRLGPRDVPQMLELVERTRPGPFFAGTIRLGDYYGIRRGGTLVAMAGERMRPNGWTEVSAVCTDTAHRGQGLGTRLVRTVVAGARARGERPFMHAAAENTGAIRLYESLGFRLHRETTVLVAIPPQR